MTDLETYREILTHTLLEWNQAERDIKQAEQVSLRVTEPSIKELRYAGRRVTEAIHDILAGGADPEHIRNLLHDADFDCHRARHDAVDAATSKMAIDLRAMTDKLGHNVVLKAYPNFPSFINSLSRIRRKIVTSREDRQNRDKIYEAIEKVDLTKIVSDFQDIIESEDIMKSLAGQERRNMLLVCGLGAIEVVVAVLSLVGIVLWFMTKAS